MRMLCAGSAGRVLFLGYGPSETELVSEVFGRNVEVWHSSERLGPDMPTAFDVVFSYGYRYILPDAVIRKSGPIINLHISYLPFNRGAHPNYWAFADRTPHGVTIHLIDSGIDTGPILFQRRVNFSAEEDTFSRTYKRLKCEIEGLFLDHLDDLLFTPLAGRAQPPGGNYHKASDLPNSFPGWDTNIAEWLNKVK